MDKGNPGSFLVRASTHSPGDYVLSAQVDGEVTHVIIKRRNNKFDVGGGPSFKELQELVEYYKKTPLVETTGRVIQLKLPFHATSFLPCNIKQRFTELEKQTQDVYGKAAFWEEFEVCTMFVTIYNTFVFKFLYLFCFCSKFSSKSAVTCLAVRKVGGQKTSPRTDTRIYCHVSLSCTCTHKLFALLIRLPLEHKCVCISASRKV